MAVINRAHEWEVEDILTKQEMEDCKTITRRSRCS